MQESIVYLIRHGDVENPTGLHYGRSRDIGLSKNGFRQLEELGKVMLRRGEKPVVIYASPLRRGQESARSLFPDVQVITLDELIESDTKGFEGKTIAQERSIVDNYQILPKGMMVEDPGIVASRVISAVTRARIENSGKVVALISHGDPIAYATYRFLHNDSPFPQHQEIAKSVFPEKGSGWRLVFNREGQVVSRELVSSDIS